jgi:alanyl-tRNA synthetase
LYFTVFGGHENLPPDHDAAKLWLETGAPKDRVREIPGLKDNFWAMGDTGPCGPCSEIFYDMGKDAVDDPKTPECAAGNCKFPCDCGRYVEIWNLVFMQFNRDASGKLNPLPKPSVDTGMGLERVAAVLQNKISNFDTDLFTPLEAKAEKLTGLSPGSGEGEDAAWDSDIASSLRIIADHSRAATFLVSDGAVPSNEGRGYVLRKIINRCLVNARVSGPILVSVLPSMAEVVAQQMREPYPELSENLNAIMAILTKEAERYVRTTETALAKLDEEITRVEQAEREWRSSQPGHPIRAVALPKHFVFKLYDTYGLQRDLIEEAVRIREIGVDWTEFEQDLQQQRERGKASWKGAHKEAASPVYRKLADKFKKTEPDFYFGTTTKDSRIEAIVTVGKNGGVETGALKAGQEGEVVLDRTAIYSESGGQVADTGKIFDNGMSLEVAEVRGAYYPVAGLIAHRIVAKEDLAVGDRVATVADAARRERIMRNHSGTHLVHAALRNILGTHVKQAGSLNAPDHLRFDFSHFAHVGADELREIEEQVNEEIRRDLPFQTDVMNIEDALASGALAFFGDKYPEQNVRVVTIADAAYPRGFYSKELCGGTHGGRTGEIGVFKIALEQSVAAGVRRIEALTGDAALAKYQSALGTLRTLAEMLNTGEERVLEAVEKLEQERKQLEKQVEGLKRKTAVSMADSLLQGARTVKGIKVVAANVPGLDREALRQLADGLRQKMGSGMVVLASGEPAQDGGSGRVSLITAVTKDLTNRLHAGKIVQEIAKHLGGSGGGRPDLAEAGGKDVAGIETAIAQVYPLVERLV